MVLCYINHYDDGLEPLKKESNLWSIIDTNNRGKYVIQHISKPDIIRTISTWKVTIVK